MARTRAESKILVESHTGHTKDTLENSLHDTALKVAAIQHPFNDTCSTPADFTITDDATSVDISSVSPIHVITARIVEADGTQNAPLIIKGRQWWDKNIINPEDNPKGWPAFGLRWGSTIVLDRPAKSGLELRLRISTAPTYTDDSTECPIGILDTFIEQYVTAFIFLDMTMLDKFIFWKREALGRDWDKGIVGGSLLQAINSDKFDLAQDLSFERGARPRVGGIAVLNQITGHPREGEVDWWS